MAAPEERLPGGFVTEVIRIGDTVRRSPPARAGFVTDLLRHLATTAPGLAPRHLGVDEQGRQVLTHLAGRVPWRDREDPTFFADPALARLAELIRALHDAVAPGVSLPRGELVAVMLDQLDGTWRGIDAGADRDEPGMRRLRTAGAVDAVRGWHEWLGRHRPAVEAALGTR